MLMTAFMRGLAAGPVKIHLFRLELDTLEEAILVAEQEDFSLRQAHASSGSYRPPRRQKSEVQDLWTSVMLSARDLALQPTSDSRILIAVRK